MKEELDTENTRFDASDARYVVAVAKEYSKAAGTAIGAGAGLSFVVGPAAPVLGVVAAIPIIGLPLFFIAGISICAGAMLIGRHAPGLAIGMTPK